MQLFRKKSISRSKTLGERLKKVREEAGISIEQAAADLAIKREYLASLEGGDYSGLPGAVYVESFLKRYAEYLQVSSDFVLDLFHRHEKRVMQQEPRTKLFTPKRSVPRPVITPRIIKRIILIAIIAVCLTYLGFELMNIFSPPELVLDFPNNFITVTQSSIDVRGRTMPEATVKINGESMLLNTDGSFFATISLREGSNTISVSAKKDRSREAVIERYIIYNPLEE